MPLAQDLEIQAPRAADLPPPDLRSAAILAAVHRAFTSKGFDGASMQDLAREAGMSVGNFYRYFPSKAAIVEAIITRDLEEFERDFSEIIASEDPMQQLRQTIRRHVHDNLCNGDGRLWAEISAAALRKPEIATIVGRMETDLTQNMTALFAIVSGLPLAEARDRYSAHAGFVVLLVKSSAMQACTEGPARAGLTELILRTIDRTLDEIPVETRKG